MSGNRHNGGIIGVKNTPGRATARGIWDFSSKFLDPINWPYTATYGLPITDNLARRYSAQVLDTMFNATSGGDVSTFDQPVARWEDISNNSSHCTQAVAGSQPILKSSVINNFNGLYFDGSDKLILSLNVNFLEGATLFIVGRQTGFSLFNILHYFRGNNAINHHPYGGAFYDGFASSTRKSWAQSAGTNAFLYSIVASSDTWTAYFNGSQVYSTSHTLAAQYETAAIGDTANNGFVGYVGEVILYESALNSSQHTEVANTIIQQWAIT